MKIDKEKLINLLVEKTSSEREEIRNQLDQLIDRILDAAKRGKALEINGFGEFYFDEEGELKFDPAEELSTEISFKYAGMKPVEVKPERQSTIAGLEEETEDESTEPDDLEFDGSTETDEEEKEDFFDELLTPEEAESKTDEDVKPLSKKPVRRRNDKTGVLILAAIILLAVLIGGYFYFTDMQDQNLNEQTETVENQAGSDVEESQISGIDDLASEPETENGPEPASGQELTEEEGQTSSEQEGTEEVSDGETAPDGGTSISENGQSAYGLKGSLVELEEAGYSIVLHSFDTEDRAISAAEQLRGDGYRVQITTRTVYENEVWRVSVGQFQSLADAQQATTLLPSPYNTQNFIQRNTD